MNDIPIIKEGITIVPVYDHRGDERYGIPIHDRLTFISGRVCKGESGLYYKGTGTLYRNHSVLDPTDYPADHKTSEVFYYGYTVSNRNWVGKFGIFPEKMQPYFSDMIGACGPKELKIIKNSTDFMMSSVRVDNVVNWTEGFNKQYYFVLHYDCGRRKYIDDPNPDLLLVLLEYMIGSEWCAPWDKGFIGDITADGRVSDVADLFRSRLFKHRLGTVYAAFYSLWQRNKAEFIRIANKFGWNNVPTVDGLWAGVYIVSLAARFIGEHRIHQPKRSDMFALADAFIGKQLIKGRNCGAVENVANGTKIAKQYQKRYRRIISETKNSDSRGNSRAVGTD